MSDDSTIGKTVKEYTANRQHVACLEKQLSDIGTQLVKIGDMLSNDAERVTVSQHHVQISNPNKFAIGSEWDTKEDVAREDLDPGKWHGLLEDLAKSQEIDGRLAKSLRTMNLADLIRE